MANIGTLAKAAAVVTIAAIGTWYLAVNAVAPWEDAEIIPGAAVIETLAAILAIIIGAVCLWRIARNGPAGQRFGLIGGDEPGAPDLDWDAAGDGDVGRVDAGASD
jgi:hypothetical protein